MINGCFFRKLVVVSKSSPVNAKNFLWDVTFGWMIASMMKYLQRLGKSLMLPVACLPVAGILMGLGYLLAPTTMQGGNAEASVALILGTFFVKAGAAIIDNMSVLFAIGVAVGMAKEQDGTPALAGIVAWFVIQTLLSPGFIGVLTGGEVDPAFNKVNNQFIGIMSGIVGATCYNRFSGTKLPDFLAFFSGKRSVAIVTALISIVLAAILFFVWPLIYNALVLLGESVISLGAVGAGIYAFLNRLLIPIGMHHALNAVFWFDVAGISDLTKFWAGTGTYGVTGMYMTGFFPVMMFGLPAAAFAMYQCAKPERKKAVVGLLASAAFCSFFTGVTEPLEFAFMFLAPGLYVLYAVMTGITAAITVMLPIRAGFSFSAGFLDLFFSSQTPLAQNPWMIIVVGLATAVVYYLVFRIAIVKFDFKTPGREDEDAPVTTDLKGDAAFVAYAEKVLEGLGGKENITSVDNCITRIRCEVVDSSKVNDSILKAAGAKGVLHPSNTAVQVIVGTQVQFVVDELKKLLK